MDIKEEFSPFEKREMQSRATGAFISIYWRCCNTFSRIYKNKDQTAYEGHCPRCRSFASAPIGEGGTNQRVFIAE